MFIVKERILTTLSVQMMWSYMEKKKSQGSRITS